MSTIRNRARSFASVLAFAVGAWAPATWAAGPGLPNLSYAGSEVFKHSVSISTGGGGLVYDLSGRCSACGHSTHELDMR